MTYETPKEYDNLKVIKVIEYPTSIWEKAIFGRFECFGYGNKVSGPLRTWAALWMTFISAVLLVLFMGAVSYLLGRLGFPIANIDGQYTVRSIDQQAFIGVILLLVSTFGAIAWKERKDVHEKWSYLAEVFNRMVVTPAPANGFNPRAHLAACLAQDALTMQMWAHRSFRSNFNAVLEEAVLLHNAGDITAATSQLKAIASDGVKYDDAHLLISKLIGFVSPDCDSAESLLAQIKSVPKKENKSRKFQKVNVR